MLELDMPVTNGECCFCEIYFAAGIDEHEETCPAGLNWSKPARIAMIYANRIGRLRNIFHNVHNKLLRNEPLPVKTELGPDFCINCTSLEQHVRDNCLKMPRNQAFEAICPSLQFKMFQVFEDFNIVSNRAEEEEMEKGFEVRKGMRQENHDANVERLRIERASSRTLRIVQREYKQMCKEEDDEANQKRTSFKEHCRLKYRRKLQICASQCQELLACYKSLSLLIERTAPSRSMIRFVSTYNPEIRQQAEPLKLFLYEDNE